MTEYQDFTINERMEYDWEYADVLEELARDDCNGTHYISELPDASEVEKVLSDKAQVRFFIYTKERIYLIHIDSETSHGAVDGKIEFMDYERWDLIILPR